MQGTCFTEGIRTIRIRAGSAKLYVVLCHFLISGCSFFSFHILSVFAAIVSAITFFFASLHSVYLIFCYINKYPLLG